MYLGFLLCLFELLLEMFGFMYWIEILDMYVYELYVFILGFEHLSYEFLSTLWLHEVNFILVVASGLN